MWYGGATQMLAPTSVFFSSMQTDLSVTGGFLNHPRKHTDPETRKIPPALHNWWTFLIWNMGDSWLKSRLSSKSGGQSPHPDPQPSLNISGDVVGLCFVDLKWEPYKLCSRRRLFQMLLQVIVALKYFVKKKISLWKKSKKSNFVKTYLLHKLLH